MAIINCPECNGQISTTAKKCIHCGYEFRICPECNAVLPSAAPHCTACGYKIENNSQKEKTIRSNDLSLISVIHKCESEKILIKDGFKNSVLMILSLAGAAMLLLSIFSIIDWASSDSAEIITGYKDCLSSVKTYVILFAVFLALSPLVRLSFDLYRSRCIKIWCNINHVDLTALIKDDILRVLPALSKEGAFKQLRITTMPCVRGERYSTSPHTISKERTIAIVSLLASALFATLLAVFIITNVELYMEKTFWVGNVTWNSEIADELKFKIEDIENWWMLISAIVCYIIQSIMDTKYHTAVKEANNAWIAKFLPECNATYKNCINSLPEYMQSYV